MATMSARFPGKCACCGGSISVGDLIEWSKGEGARHASCAASPSAAPARRASRSSERRHFGSGYNGAVTYHRTPNGKTWQEF